MAQITNNTPCCATCSNWLGYRTLNRLGYVEVISRGDKAKCGAQGRNESREYQACYCCSKYSKWSVLK